MARGSAAWVLAIFAVVIGVVGSLVLTVLDPVAQALFASPNYSSSTTYGSDLLQWLVYGWEYWPVFLLMGVGVTVWVRTRRAG